MKSTYEIRESEPINMLGGLPVIVAALPMFDAVATAIAYGMEGRPSRRVIRRTNGVIIRHTMSFTRNAESNPLVKITVGNK